MADTERTLTSLQTLMADNATGDISPQDIRDMLVSTSSEKILKAATTPLYDDYIIPGISLGKTATNPPDLVELRNGIYLNAFDQTTSEQGFFAVHLLHDLKYGTDMTWHVHWTHNNASPSGAVKWNIDYSMAKGYETDTFDAPTTITTTQTAAAQYTHHITPDDMTVPFSASMEPDSVIIGRIYRDAGDAADTFADDAFLIQFDLHYQMAQYGTEERNRPFTSAGW